MERLREWWYVILYLPLIILLTPMATLMSFQQPVRHIWLYIIWSLFSVMLVFVALLSTALGVSYLYLRYVVGSYVPFESYQLLAVFVIWVTGTLLYRFRCRRTFMYGTFEILVGISFAVFAVNSVAGNVVRDVGAHFGCAGALYIVVRGYDNIYKSLKDPNTITLWNKHFFGQDTPLKLA